MPFEEQTTAIDWKIEEKWKEIARLLADASKLKSSKRKPEATLKKQLSDLANLRAERTRLVARPLRRRRAYTRSADFSRHSDSGAAVGSQEPRGATILGPGHPSATKIKAESSATWRRQEGLSLREFDSTHHFGLPRISETSMELPIFDRQSRLVGWTRRNPEVGSVRLRHAYAELLVGCTVGGVYVEIEDPADAKRAGAPPGWKGPWRCLALCSAWKVIDGVAH